MSSLNHIVGIYRTIKDGVKVDSTIEGFLEIRDGSTCAFVRSADNDSVSDDIGLSVLSELEDVQVGNTIQIKLFQPKAIPVYPSLSVFLGNGLRLLEPPGDFYLIEEDLYSADPEPSAEIKKLQYLHQILVQMNDAATMADKAKQRFIFTDSAGFVDIPINISPDDLKALTSHSVGMFVDFCTDSLHRKHRLAALANVIVRQTRGVLAKDRMHHVLKNLDSILSDAKSQHAVFLSAFSYEKVRDEVESLKIEYTTKIHKVLSEIQGQLLGIPAATVIVATQMKKTEAIDSVFITNVAVLFGALIFGVFLVLLLKNQSHTLEVIRDEVFRQKKQLRAELPEVADRFNDVFSMLQQRIKHQGTILWSVGMAVGIGLVLSFVAFWMLSSCAINSFW